MPPTKDESTTPTETENDSEERVSVLSKKGDIMGVLTEIRDGVREYKQGTSDALEANAKATEDLKTEITAQRTELTQVSEAVADLKDEGEETHKGFWDSVGSDVHNKAVVSLWGYQTMGDPIAKAMYTPQVQLGFGAKAQSRSDLNYDLPRSAMEMNDFLHLWGLIKSFKQYGGYNEDAYRSAIKGTQTYRILIGELARYDRDFRKALNTATSGEGSDWIPTQFSSQFIDDYRLLLKVAAQFVRVTIPMGQGSMPIPRQGGRRRAYLQGEATDDNPSQISSVTPGTGSVTFTPVKHAVMIRWSDEMNEDSAVAMLPIVLAELRQAIADGEEDAQINGDTSTTHQDSDVTAADDIRKSFQGLRNHGGNASGQASVDLSSVNTTNFRAMRKAKGRWGVNPADNFWLTGISGFVQMLGITEVLTMDLIGPAATVVQGQLGSYDGSPIIVSEFVREDLNLTGVFDDTTETDTVYLHVNRRAFYAADKGVPRNETERDIKTGQNYSVASRRLDFKQTANVQATEETVAVGYSVTS